MVPSELLLPEYLTCGCFIAEHHAGSVDADQEIVGYDHGGNVRGSLCILPGDVGLRNIALANASAHHEFKGLRTDVRFECETSPLLVVDGKIKVPTGPGLGVEIDADFIKKHEEVKG